MKACDSIYLRGGDSDCQNVRSRQLRSVLPRSLPFVKFSGSVKIRKKNSLKMYNLCFSYQIYYSRPSICLIFIWVLRHHCSMPMSSKILPKNIKIAVVKIFPLWYIILGHRQSCVCVYIHTYHICVCIHTNSIYVPITSHQTILTLYRYLPKKKKILGHSCHHSQA